MTASTGLDRRTFMKLIGEGVVVLVSIGPSALCAQNRKSYPEDFNAYLRIAPDGRVTVFSGKIEMGQGVMTSQAQMAAEELGVALDAVEMVLGDTDQCPWDAGTWGSLTTRVFGPALRAAAAEARLVLTTLASKKLGVPRDQLVVENGVVSVAGDRSRKVSYGELAEGKRIARVVDEKAVLRAASEFKLMGQSPRRLDGHDKVTGRGKFAGDIRRPGMLYARILRPPAHGATLKSVDTSAVKGVPEASVIRDGDLIAVLHPELETAERALGLVKAEWNQKDSDLDQESIFEHLLQSGSNPDVGEQRGDVSAARTAAARVFESTYFNGYVAHAPIEPHTALADVKDGKATIWASTQSPFGMRDQVAKAIGFDPKDVRVITPYVGGGFGGKGTGPQGLEAARLSKAAGKPVQVMWTRGEEFFYDTFRPAAVVKIASATGADGKISLWDYDVYFAGARGSKLFYDIPNATVRSYANWSEGRGNADRTSVHPFNVGPWRAPGANTNVFAIESQIDIMAAAAGIDPLEFRLRNTSDKRMRGVLTAAAKAFGWKTAPGPSGMGRAVACGIDAGSYVAEMAQVKVNKDGAVQVERVVCAQDMGMVVNPDGAAMQIEGCIAMGLGYVFTEELRFRGGEVLDQNFGTYELPRFSWMPKIETVLVKNDELLPQGGGEPAIVPMGGLIANAIFDATGARLYRLPMTPERVRAAMEKAHPRT